MNAANDRYMAAVGMFDGMHAGHIFVLGELRRLAAARGLKPMVISFANHPADVVAPRSAPALVIGPIEKENLIHTLGGIDRVDIIPFTRQFAAMTARQFLSGLRERGVEALAMGFNNHIGSDRLTADAAATLGIVDIVGLPPCPGGESASSSALRRAISAADFEAAAAILSRPYTITGTVVPGKQLGRTIGYPTANIAVEDSAHRLLPPDGVYAADVTIDGIPGIYRTMVNIGLRPTVDSGTAPLRTIEAHIFDLSADLYGHRVRLSFLRRLRAERRFDSLEALAAQLAADASAALEL